eukprot:938779-Pyramimonas_sp.AAC.2
MRATRACLSQVGSPQRRSGSSTHCRGSLSNALLWSANSVAVAVEGEASATASLMSVSTRGPQSPKE